MIRWCDLCKNIAITGIYGSGKSTVWKSYSAKKKLENIITVSLGKYEDNMLKDGLFFSKNRMKFFDFIIPIVPVVDSKTSELKTLLLDVSKAPDNKVLLNISLYVDDMRLLKNIVNEFIVYSNIIPLEPLELDKNKLFALITFKNIFPNEFDLLQEDKGYIRSVFDKLESHRRDVIENFELELEELNQRIDFFNDRFKNDKYDAMALMIPVDVRIQRMGNVTWSEHL